MECCRVLIYFMINKTCNFYPGGLTTDLDELLVCNSLTRPNKTIYKSNTQCDVPNLYKKEK